jgi:hypothetical protein
MAGTAPPTPLRRRPVRLDGVHRNLTEGSPRWRVGDVHVSGKTQVRARRPDSCAPRPFCRAWLSVRRQNPDAHEILITGSRCIIGA